MPTLSEFVTNAGTALAASPSGDWGTTQLTEWVRETIREMSQVITRTAVYPITIATDGQLTYELNPLVRSVASVEVGGRACTPFNRFQVGWTSGRLYYNLQDWGDATANPTLYLSTGAAALAVQGETLTVVAHVAHDDTVGDDDPLTVPDTLLHILQSGVTVRAYQQALADKMTDLNMDERDWMRRELQRAERVYHEGLSTGSDGRSLMVQWAL